MSRALQVYDELIAALRSGKYRPGDRILAEDVAKSLNVSRTPVREALSRLVERRLLEMTPSGLSVAQFDRQAVLELYALREILEGAAARFAAQHASASDIYAMRRISASLADAHETDAPRLAQLNRAFHNALYEATHNRFLVDALAGLNDALMLLPGTTFTTAGRRDAAASEHDAILDAIEARDPYASEEAARHHIRRSRDTRLGMMFEY